MNRIASVILIVAVMAVFVPGAFVSAQGGSFSLTITEAELNSLPRVTNPINRNVSNVSVDLQPGQVHLAMTLTGRNGQAWQTVSIWEPRVENGRLLWTLVSVTANGAALPQNLTAALNNAARSIQQAMQQAIRAEVGARYTLTEVTVTDDAFTVTGTR